MRIIYTGILLLLMLQAGATVRYVRASAAPGGNGLTWATAYNNLETALNASTLPGDQVWVSQGTYAPTTSGSFTIKPGVQVYGGFPATGSPAMTDARWQTYRTYLQKASANSSIVAMSGVNTSNIINGFYIQNGNAADGAGIYMTGSGSTGSVPTLQNIVFDKCVATNHGGGMQVINAMPVLINIVFQNCKAAYGGGISTEDAAPDIRRCAFEKDSATLDGGAIYYNGTPATGQQGIFTDVVMYNNWASRAGGGANLQGDGALPKFLNCTFVNNTSASTNGSGLHSFSPSGTATSSQITVTAINCLFYKNTNTQGLADIGSVRSTNTVTYSFFSTAANGVDGNVTYSGTTASPFNNINSPKGADTTWLTADDGLIPAICNIGATVVDKGNNDAISYTVDAAGLSRKQYISLRTGAVADITPVVDMGAYENQTTYTAAQLGGRIGNAHSIPYPQELAGESITNDTVQVINTVKSNIAWQASTDNSTWFVLPVVAGDSQSYPIPASLSQTTWFRRVATTSFFGCSSQYPSNTVRIKVVDPTGYINGTVKNKTNSAGIPGDTIYVKRIGRGFVPGTDTNKVYFAVSDNQGDYRVNGIYYGDQDVSSSRDTFRLTPHNNSNKFDPPTFQPVVLSYQQPYPTSGIAFKDTSVFTINGQINQKCDACWDIAGNQVVNNVYCPIDSVRIIKDGVPTYDYTAYNTLENKYGRYTTTVSNAGTSNTILKPSFQTHLFSPADTTLLVKNNVFNVDFTDTTTHLISGYLTAGCKEYIGTAVLLFTDVLPNGPNNSVRPVCFAKRVTTTFPFGKFEVRLPARKYKVSVVSYTTNLPGQETNPLYIYENTLTTFFNNLPVDDVTRDITNQDTTLNLEYIRPAVIKVMTGLKTKCDDGITDRGFAIFNQIVADTFRLKVYERLPLNATDTGCPFRDTSKLQIITSVPLQDNISQTFRYPLADTGILLNMRGGMPNIIPPFRKELLFKFIDRFGRQTLLDQPTVVLGTKSNIGTFTTTSPEVPFMILHRPPGDKSYSTWEKHTTRQTAVRFFSQTDTAHNRWADIKLGFRFSAGVAITVENNVWGQLSTDITTTGRSTSSSEQILTLDNSELLQTPYGDYDLDGDGDVFYTAAINFAYSGATEVKLKNCGVDTATSFIMAPVGLRSDVAYTAGFIRNQKIPELNMLAQAQANPLKKDSLLNQVKVWQQLLNNNEANKAAATYKSSYSFNGGIGRTLTSSTTTSGSSSIEFGMNIDSAVAASVGFEVAGSGAQGGSMVTFRMETGNSTTEDTVVQSTTSCHFEDDDPLDNFWVNIKQDPCYGSPVFELQAGTSSCPYEGGTRPRDEVALRLPQNTLDNVPANSAAIFQLYVGNTSQSYETRNYRVNVDVGSNPNAALITMGGFSTTSLDIDSIAYGQEKLLTVRVQKDPSSDVYSYEGLRFIVTDKCFGNVRQSALVTARFAAPCSNVTMTAPADGWILNKTYNNLLPVLINDYNTATLTTISLEYSLAGSNTWQTGFVLNASQLNSNSTEGTIKQWDVSALADGNYSIRLMLKYGTVTVYSTRATGIIDRTGPTILGRPEPTDDNYVRGDVIAFNYNDKLNTTNLNTPGLVTMTLEGSNINLPITVSGYDNRIVIVPSDTIYKCMGKVVRVVVKGLTDIYNNPKIINDTSYILIGSSNVNTGSRALIASMFNRKVYKNSDSAIGIIFKLPTAVSDTIRVNYTIGGTARYGIDYTLEYVGYQPPASSFGGVQGNIRIPKNNNQVTFLIRPIGDTALAPEKTVIISLTNGGDYNLGDTTSVTGIITSEDGIANYTFTGNGNFNVKSNWLNYKMPLTTLAPGKTIFINPSGICTLNVPLTIKPGATLRVMQNKQFIIPGNLKLN